jgi:hypothetical protein
MAMRKSAFGATLAALQRAEAQLEQLRKQAADERHERLRDLHVSYGFASRSELVDALLELNAVRRSTRQGAQNSAPRRPGGKRRRARITTETRAEVVRAAKSSEVGASIAKRLGISIQSVQNIKKAAGLVRSRSS